MMSEASALTVEVTWKRNLDDSMETGAAAVATAASGCASHCAACVGGESPWVIQRLMFRSPERKTGYVKFPITVMNRSWDIASSTRHLVSDLCLPSAKGAPSARQILKSQSCPGRRLGAARRSTAHVVPRASRRISPLGAAIKRPMAHAISWPPESTMRWTWAAAAEEDPPAMSGAQLKRWYEAPWCRRALR